jgi:pimeloyl-ACP methyl ester carboxylesterase
MGNRKFSLIIFALAATLIGIGCSRKKIEYPAPSAEGKGGSIVTTTGTFKFHDKDYPADYGTITVNENRSSINSRLIHLPVIRIHARTSNTNPPIFCLAGGPGQSNMNWSPIDSLLSDHDFVMVGYRGVDGSIVLDCPEIGEAFKNKAGNNLLSEESLRKIGEAWNTAAIRLKSQGIDVDGYTIPETIEDMEYVRTALNYNRINLLSESYGTRVAYIYGLMHPEKINRTVMVGVNPPGGFAWDPVTTDEQLKYYARLWSEDSFMTNKSPDLYSAMKNVLNNMPHKWLFFSIDPGKVRAVTFCLLFHRNTAAMVFDSFIAAEQGDYSGIALMSLASDFVIPSMFVWGELASKAMSADFDSLKDYSGSLENKRTILGSPLNELYWGSLKYGRFPVKMIPEELRTLQKSDVQTLMLSGSVDFTNPPECGTEMLPCLPNGKQIILYEYGHVGDLRYLNQSMTDRIITNYFNTGIADASGIAYVPMDFKVSWGFPLIAKVSLAVIFVVIIILIFLVVWLIRKFRSRKMKESDKTLFRELSL